MLVRLDSFHVSYGHGGHSSSLSFLRAFVDLSRGSGGSSVIYFEHGATGFLSATDFFDESGPENQTPKQFATNKLPNGDFQPNTHR